MFYPPRALRFPFLPVLAALLLAACGAETSAPDAPPPAANTPPVVVTPPVEEASPPALNALADSVDALFTDAAASDTFAGSVIVVDAGKQVLAKGYGLADRVAKKPNTPDTIFRVASVSKQFAATAVLALAQDGKLALTDPVSKFLPDYPKESLTKEGVELTIHHLLSHTSGLPDPQATAGFKRLAWKRAMLPVEVVDFVKASPLGQTPGAVYEYLNYNFLLAAVIVEKVSGQPYETFLRKRFFEPLDMKDTGTILPASVRPRAAVGYTNNDGTTYIMNDDPTFKDRDVTLLFGSGQVYSTVRDLAKWDRALTGETVLPSAKRNLLFTPNLDGYGYGWVISKRAGVTYEWHNGALSPFGASAYVVRVRSKDRFVAYLANRDHETVGPFEAKVAALAVK